jgi:hypothetical protein
MGEEKPSAWHTEDLLLQSLDWYLGAREKHMERASFEDLSCFDFLLF